MVGFLCYPNTSASISRFRELACYRTIDSRWYTTSIPVAWNKRQREQPQRSPQSWGKPDM